MIIINGDFLCRNLTGIERFAYETCIRLDSLVEKDSVMLYVPKNAFCIPNFKNIKIVVSRKKCTCFPIWEHGVFSYFVRRNHAVSLDFSNVTPLFSPGIVFIHDIYAKLYPQDFQGKRDFLMRLYMCAMYKHAVGSAKKIITVSEFSRREIARTYSLDESKISVIYNGWEHVKNIQADFSIFKSFPQLETNDFYFALNSFQKRKNLKWITDYALKHPETLFAISGKAISGLVSNELHTLRSLPNIILLGYVSDGQVKALMERCKAFIFPSYYEGFGIPPLEALACGAPVIISNAACLPELYGNTAHYIDPYSTDTDLDNLLKNPVEPPDGLLKKYSYQSAAEALYNLIKSR
ncbi:glycosyltransferase family 4 protein [Treponema brennaborense]|uniref:Glycosyl transferase group 1 n=1 Tax=Treponema brennaborense (strain DSM 12168 / CIP 105900 / DD5/3) TaxID=906968 RepID=F4LMI4_TREBD|nr:glycosyltransferase family 1 protein [Treponema brennaborense]AEE15746.1 glycosyl transferase group 1 [Treponema brennaborense DSM 12168]